MQVQELNSAIEQLRAEDARKFSIIQQLEVRLSKTMHNQNLSRSNTNLQGVDAIKTYYEGQIEASKKGYENQIHQLHEQISYYQQLAEEYQAKYGNLLDEFEALSRGQKVQTHESATISQSETQIKMRNHIAALENERNVLISMIEDYKNQLLQKSSQTTRIQQYPAQRGQYVEQEVTYYQHGGNYQGDQEEVVERMSYQIQGNNEIIQKVTYRTDN